LTTAYKSDRNAASRNGGRAVALTMVGGLLFTAAYGAWWVLTPEHAYRVLTSTPGGSHGVIMVLDSPEVRRIILAKDTARDAEVARAGRRDGLRIAHDMFVSAIERQPSVLVAKDSYVRLLEEARVHCEGDLITPYALVRVTSGPSRGKEGWLCLGGDFVRTPWLE
jgi:hypothetical protein